jgi:hypothetical protein
LHLWLPGILQKNALYFGESEQGNLWEEWSCSTKYHEKVCFKHSGNDKSYDLAKQSHFSCFFSQSYQTVINNEEYIVHYSITRPDRFWGRLPTMSSIHQKPGIGWDRVNTDNCVNTGRTDEGPRREVMMTTSHQYKEAHIQLMTMRKIKVTTQKSNDFLLNG